MKPNYITTELYGDTVPGIEYEGVEYARAEYTGQTAGKIRLLYSDEETHDCGALIDDEYGEHWWMPLAAKDWWKLRRCYATDPDFTLYFETSFSMKKGLVTIRKLGIMMPKSKSKGEANEEVR